MMRTLLALGILLLAVGARQLQAAGVYIEAQHADAPIEVWANGVPVSIVDGSHSTHFKRIGHLLADGLNHFEIRWGQSSTGQSLRVRLPSWPQGVRPSEATVLTEFTRDLSATRAHRLSSECRVPSAQNRPQSGVAIPFLLSGAPKVHAQLLSQF